MTEAAVFPDLAKDLVRIHKVITRGMSIAVAGGDEFQEEGFPEPGVRKGFTDYVMCLERVLGGHHKSEDEIAFPAFARKIPAAPYEKLASDHREMEKLSSSLRKSISDVADEGDQGDIKLLVDTTRRISAIWAPHIRIEEEYFSHDNVAKVMTLEEQGLIGANMGKKSQEVATPPSLVVPFVLYNLEGEERAAMSATLPKNLVEELIPVTWKDQWAPMLPFLLK